MKAKANPLSLAMASDMNKAEKRKKFTSVLTSAAVLAPPQTFSLVGREMMPILSQ